MTRADIVDRIYEKVGLSKKEAQEIIEIIIDTITETLKEGETVKITGFGTFTVRKKAPRRGRNPKTGEEVEISARRVVSFRPSNILKEKVNS
jgi:integration host factor subunit alpha